MVQYLSERFVETTRNTFIYVVAGLVPGFFFCGGGAG